MNWPDVLTLVLVLLAAVAGLRRGFWLELMLLLGVILAVATSAWVTPKLSALLPPHAWLHSRIVFVALFLVVAAILSGLFEWLAQQTRGVVPKLLVPLDRLLGFLLGGLKGALVAGLVGFVLLLPQAPAKVRAAAAASHLTRMSVRLDAVALDQLSLPLPVLRGAARAFDQSLHPRRHPAPTPVVVRERPARNSNA
ncbi:MAG TPA: CvpA family protein [Candidatus Saccharimonadales bacterium]|nr:CvpA family protein [Candidatus Saccharimonadales bacterium]